MRSRLVDLITESRISLRARVVDGVVRVDLPGLLEPLILREGDSAEFDVYVVGVYGSTPLRLLVDATRGE